MLMTLQMQMFFGDRLDAVPRSYGVLHGEQPIDSWYVFNILIVPMIRLVWVYEIVTIIILLILT